MYTSEMTINGRIVPASRTFKVLNPATEEYFADAPDCTPSELEEAMRGAKHAFGSWAATTEQVRRQALAAAADALESSLDELAEVLTREQGKPLSEARMEVSMTALTLRAFAGLEMEPEVVFRDDESAYVRLTRRPSGVVVAITAWNFPLALAARKVGPAILAGNTVVLKPSPFTPLSTLLMGKVLREVFPPGVLNVVTGGDALGASMTSHPLPRRISFTGSTATGKQIAQSAGSDLKRLVLELGGNDPAIVIEDVDVATVAQKIFASAFVNCGQVCSAIKRVYVPHSLRDEMTDALVGFARSKRVGNGLDDGVDLGPLSNKPQLERVMGLVGDATSHGATVAAGGRRLGEVGYFFEPTVITDVCDGVRLVDEEQFGPVLPIITYDSLEDVIGRVNAGHFGLDASIWGVDGDRVLAVARQIEAGTVWMNTHGARTVDQPTGGLKWSGLGVENGRWGYEELTDLQVLYLARS